MMYVITGIFSTVLEQVDVYE